MTCWALFWTELYFSWLLIEYIAGRYEMIKNSKVEIMSVIGLALFGIFIACASPEEPKVVDDAERFAVIRAHNDSIAISWKQYYDEQAGERVITKELMTYKPDSSKIIAIAYPDDAFTDFEQAFMTARAELGPGKVFFWLSKGYTTDYKTE